MWERVYRKQLITASFTHTHKISKALTLTYRCIAGRKRTPVRRRCAGQVHGTKTSLTFQPDLIAHNVHSDTKNSLVLFYAGVPLHRSAHTEQNKTLTVFG